VQPVGQKEGLEFIEIAIVENENELAAVRLKALDRMRNPSGEESHITLANVLNKGSSFLIHSGDARGARNHVGPF
jgi:hypothetical protein